ncbi:MAG: hypothetical protein MI757_03765 [Pirellulales bacterium]|nr:hypothetical protein [Pirellulales bacterium]
MHDAVKRRLAVPEWFVGLWCVFLTIIVGCSSSDADSNALAARTGSLQPGDARIQPQSQVPEAFRPLDSGEPVAFGPATHEDDAPTHYADGSPVYMPDGSPIDYRPRNIQKELSKLPVLYIRDDGQSALGNANHRLVYLSAQREHQVRFAGELPNPRLDPETGRVCWWAYECRNPNCSGRRAGQPFLFAAGIAGVVADGSANDDELLTEVDSHGMSAFDLMKCPKCGQRDWLDRPALPETVRRTAELQDELARVRGE